ncbi:hypothetical protein [Lysobacter sp. TAB13]|uniref:hypothetical protein n=1 Tax=Lysobacter sp. TAB13 TaxID=3233065 RepID=UPI003F9BDFF6
MNNSWRDKVNRQADWLLRLRMREALIAPRIPKNCNSNIQSTVDFTFKELGTTIAFRRPHLAASADHRLLVQLDLGTVDMKRVLQVPLIIDARLI